MLKHKLGDHLICELTHCSFDILNDKDFLSKLLVDSAIKGGAGVLGHIEHKFTPQGVTIVVLLSTSHLSIHTYPELKYAAVDVFTCGNTINTDLIFEEISKHVGGEKYVTKDNRGIHYIGFIYWNNFVNKIKKLFRSLIWNF